MKGVLKPKRIFCYFCDKEICKACHSVHPISQNCIISNVNLCQLCKDYHLSKNCYEYTEEESLKICKGLKNDLKKKKLSLKNKNKTPKTNVNVKTRIQNTIACIIEFLLILKSVFRNCIKWLRNKLDYFFP